jgi:hypothetical protein
MTHHSRESNATERAWGQTPRVAGNIKKVPVRQLCTNSRIGLVPMRYRHPCFSVFALKWGVLDYIFACLQNK